MRDVYVLPRFPGPRAARQVPASIDLAPGHQAKAALLAEALLDGGFLFPGDWQGSIPKTIEAGMNRWGKSMGRWRVLSLSLLCTDDISDPSCPANMADARRLWKCGDEVFACGFDRESVREHGRATMGMFALIHNPYDPLPQVMLGPAVRRLEQCHRGAGFAVWQLLEPILQNWRCWTPLVAWEWWSSCWDTRGYGDKVTEEEAEKADLNYDPEHPPIRGEVAGFTSPEAFSASFPTEIFQTHYSVASLRRRIKTAIKSTPPGFERQAFEMALELAESWTDYVADTKRLAGKCEEFLLVRGFHVIPLVADWEDDPSGISPMDRVVDDYIEMLNQGDNEDLTDVMWHDDFRLHDAASIKSAVHSLRLAMDVLETLDEFLALLNDYSKEKPIQLQVQVQV